MWQKSFFWKSIEKLLQGTEVTKGQVNKDAYLTPRPSSVHHEWAVLWEFWGRAGWSWADFTGPEADQATHHSAHAQIKSGLPWSFPKDLAQGFSTWVSTKLPAAVQKDADEPQYQPPEASLHSGPHAQVESSTLRPSWQKWCLHGLILTCLFSKYYTCARQHVNAFWQRWQATKPQKINLFE